MPDKLLYSSRTPLITLGIFGLWIIITSCGSFRTKQIQRVPTSLIPFPAKTASLVDLINKFNQFSESIRTLQLKVSYELSGGSLEAGEIQRWRESEGFVILRKPFDIRIIVQAFQIKVLDMVSDGTQFLISVPPKNKLIRGLNNQVIVPRKDLPVNIRPEHIFEALAPLPIEKKSFPLISLEENQQGRKKFYILSLHESQSEEPLSLKRKIWFDRMDLNIAKQKKFSHGGKLETEIVYKDFQKMKTQIYPKVIHILRPRDSYSLIIHTKTIKINGLLEDRVFILDKLLGAEEIDLTKEI